ncbi:MAG: monovalent cation/H+ antiporter complex subunit F [Kiloniellales bacterium]
MTAFYLGLTSFLLATLAAGMWRILRGPSQADRMLAAQLFGTTAVAVLLVLAQAMEQPALRDVGLVFALLAAVTVVAFVRRAWPSSAEESADDA